MPRYWATDLWILGYFETGELTNLFSRNLSRSRLSCFWSRGCQHHNNLVKSPLLILGHMMYPAIVCTHFWTKMDGQDIIKTANSSFHTAYSTAIVKELLLHTYLGYVVIHPTTKAQLMSSFHDIGCNCNYGESVVGALFHFLHNRSNISSGPTLIAVVHLPLPYMLSSFVPVHLCNDN